MKKNQSGIKPSSKRKRAGSGRSSEPSGINSSFIERMRQVMTSLEKGGEGGGSAMATLRHNAETKEEKQAIGRMLGKAVKRRWDTFTEEGKRNEMSKRRQLGLYRDQLIDQGMEGPELLREIKAERARLDKILPSHRLK